jgi:hypothetical protein
LKIAIMQPYFLPYLGYWQLIAAVDEFVVYDNIKYTKKGWINRNRFLLNGKEEVFTLPLRKDSDSLHVHQRQLAGSFSRPDFINKFREAYRKAPLFPQFMPLLEEIILCPSNNLFDYIFHSIQKICGYLSLKTRLTVASALECNHALKSAQRVQAICKALVADTYINPAGGTELYSKEDFEAKGVVLRFIQARPFEYPQFGGTFVPLLSIVDVAMFNSADRIREQLSNAYDLT